MTERPKLVLPSFLQRIIALAEANNFDPDFLKGDPVKLGDEVVGELSPLEKACVFVRNTDNDEAKEKNAAGVPIEDVGIQVLLRSAYMANDLLPFLIKERLAEKCPRSIIIRDGWKLVEYAGDEEDCNCLSCQAARAGSNGGIMVIKIGAGEMGSC